MVVCTEAWTAAREAPEPQSSWMDWARMERWIRRRAAVGEGRWTMQKGDWR